MTTCPHCGNPNRVAPWQQQKQVHGYATTAPLLRSLREAGTAIAPNETYSRKEPVAPGDVPNTVWPPFLISFISGTFSTITAASFLSAIDVQNSTMYGISSGGLVSLVCWYFSVRAFYRLLWREEKITSNGDGKKPITHQPRESIKAEVTMRDERGRLRQMRWFEFPPGIRHEDLEKLARALFVDKKAFSKRGAGSVLSEEKFSIIQNVLLSSKAAEYKNGKDPSTGVVLTATGRAFLRQYVETSDNGR